MTAKHTYDVVDHFTSAMKIVAENVTSKKEAKKLAAQYKRGLRLARSIHEPEIEIIETA
jgi:hypothetical protein